MFIISLVYPAGRACLVCYIPCQRFFSAKLPTGLNILIALIFSFFLFFLLMLLLFFNDLSENNYLKIRWTDFCNLYNK